MRDPHVRFCERRGGGILRSYSTAKPDRGSQPRNDRRRSSLQGLDRHVIATGRRRSSEQSYFESQNSASNVRR